MMKRLVIAGAGDFGRELVGWVQTSPDFLEKNHVAEIVFIDDNERPPRELPAPLVGTISGYAPLDNDLILCSIGHPDARRRVVRVLAQAGATFATFVHDSVLFGGSTALGEGSIVCPRVVFSTGITVGDQVHVNVACTVGHDVHIGSYTTLSSNCNLTGHVKLGSDVFVGTAVTIIPGQSVGDGSRVGAGSVVLRKIPAKVSVFGNPSKKIGDI